MELKIDSEFSALHTPLTLDERMQLADNIQADGRILDPIIYWVEGDGIILDGEHRWEIAQAHKVPYVLEGISLPDRKSAMLWILHHQAGRRNLDTHGMTRVRYKALQLTGSAEAAAEMLGVNKRTIERSREAMEAIERLPDDLRKKYENGSLIVAEADMKRLGDLSDEAFSALVDKLRSSPEKTMRSLLPVNKSVLTREEYESLKDLNISGTVRQSIHSGGVSVDSKSIRKLAKIPAPKQVLVSSVLESSEICDLGEAIETVMAGTPRRTKAPANVNDIANKVEDLVGKLARVIDDAGEAIGDKSRTERESCMAALQSFHDVFKRWVGRYKV